MKKNNLLLIALFLCFFSGAQSRVDSLLYELKSNSNDYIFVVSHRGDWRNAPENSISAIEGAIAMKADVVELDIQRTKDNNFVLMHDGSIDRTTTGKAKVSDFTVDELKKFTLKAATGLATNERIPTLEEALLVAKGKILVNIDKGGTYIKEILVVIKNTETENQVIIKGTYQVDRIIADYGNEVGLLYMPIVSLESATAENTIKDFNSRFKPFAYEVIFRTEDNLVLKTMPNYIGNSRLWVNTLSGRMCANHNDELAIKNPDMHWGWILKQKITIIQTDRPTELIDYLKSKSKRNLKYNNK